MEAYNQDIELRSTYATIEEVLAYGSLSWDRRALSYNSNISLDAISLIDLHVYGVTGNWYYSALSKNVPLTDITNNMNLPWNFAIMSSRKDLTFKFIHDNNLSGRFHWYGLSKRATIHDVKMYPNLPFVASVINLNEMEYPNDLPFLLETFNEPDILCSLLRTKRFTDILFDFICSVLRANGMHNVDKNRLRYTVDIDNINLILYNSRTSVVENGTCIHSLTHHISDECYKRNIDFPYLKPRNL